MPLPDLISATSLAASRGDEEGVLHALLSAWNEHRVAPLAKAIASLSGRFLRRYPPLESIEAWHTLAQRKDPLSVAALLAAPVAAKPTTLRKKLDALTLFPPDPRLALYGQQLSAQLRYVSRPGREKAYDAAEALRSRHGPLNGPGLEPGILELVAAAEALGPTTEDKLLAAVYASPDDDAPRLVYADWLMEQGDPLGKRIVRAVSGALEHELQQAFPPHHLRWLRHHLGPLQPDLVEFRRGFPIRVSVQQGPLPRFTPSWSTVEEIDLLEPSAEVMRSLSSLRHLPGLRLLGLRHVDEGPAWLAAASPLIAELGLRELCLWNPAWAPALGPAAQWPVLQCLWLTAWMDPVSLAPEDIGPISQGEPGSLEVGLWSPQYGVGFLLGRALESTPTAAPSIRRLRFQRPSRAEPSLDHRVQVTLERDEAGALRRLCLAGFDPSNVDQLWRVFGAPPPGAISEIVFESRFLRDAAFMRKVESGLAQFKRTRRTFKAA